MSTDRDPSGHLLPRPSPYLQDTSERGSRVALPDTPIARMVPKVYENMQYFLEAFRRQDIVAESLEAAAARQGYLRSRLAGTMGDLAQRVSRKIGDRRRTSDETGNTGSGRA